MRKEQRRKGWYWYAYTKRSVVDGAAHTLCGRGDRSTVPGVDHPGDQRRTGAARAGGLSSRAPDETSTTPRPNADSCSIGWSQ